MREIPDLQVLCLRAIGSHVCSVEKTFAPITVIVKDESNNMNNNTTPDHQCNNTSTSSIPSRASRLLRRFHDRNRTKCTTNELNTNSSTSSSNNKKNNIESSITQIPMIRKPCIGQGSSRRVNAYEVDLNHPMIACRMPLNSATDKNNNNNDDYSLVMQYGSTALDCLQSYIDSLVEIGRMDDTRLGIHFFNEWKANVILQQQQQQQNSNTTKTKKDNESDLIVTKPNNNSNKKRKRNEKQNSNDVKTAGTDITSTITNVPLGSLSLHNCTIAIDTFNAMIQSNMVQYLAVLDVTGVHGMNDDIAYKLFSGDNKNTNTGTTSSSPPSSTTASISTSNKNVKCCNLVRISLKNCRKISKITIQLLTECCSNTLQSLDIGGCFNISPLDVLEVLPKLYKLTSLYSSGIQWTNELLPKLINCKLLVNTNSNSSTNKNSNNNKSIQWEGLSFGFCNPIQLTQPIVKECLLQLSTSSTNNLQSLSIPFCEHIVDNALLSYMGRYLLQLQFLDIRGNYNVSTISSWYDGRLSSSTTSSTTNTDNGNNNGDTSSDEEEDGDTSTGRQNKNSNNKKVIISTELTVLARYTSITEVSLEETRRIHPQSIKSLTIYLGGTGTGSGITREYK